MHTSGSQAIQVLSSKKSPYGLSDNENDLMSDLIDTDMFKVYSDTLRSETLRIQQRKPAKFGYLPMMTMVVLGDLNDESFCECVLSCQVGCV